jgi:hypothetical protein
MPDEELISAQRNILMDLLGSCIDLGKTASVDVWKLHIDAAIDRLDQAYKEEGYVQHGIIMRPRKRYFATGPGQIPPLEEPQQPCMTGQEWYDRFWQELKAMDEDIEPDDWADAYHVRSFLEAAKKAAGIE